MGNIIIHFDREWVGNVIRMDYEWENGDKKFLIEEVPCKRLPIDTDDYLEEHVRLALGMIIHLQRKGEIKERVNFLEIEDLLDELKNE